jgi:hypothetical protein
MHNELNKLFDKMEETDKGDNKPAQTEPAEVQYIRYTYVSYYEHYYEVMIEPAYTTVKL